MRLRRWRLADLVIARAEALRVGNGHFHQPNVLARSASIAGDPARPALAVAGGAAVGIEQRLILPAAAGAGEHPCLTNCNAHFSSRDRMEMDTSLRPPRPSADRLARGRFVRPRTL